AELGDDTKLASRILKYLVQGTGSEIKGTLKYGNPQKIKETWHSFLDCNNLPELENPNDPALINRAHPIYFANTIPREKQDKQLPEKLKAEYSGILRWMVEGFSLWKKEGLEKPAGVEAALKRWREDSNSVAKFIYDCCVRAEREDSASFEPLRQAY